MEENCAQIYCRVDSFILHIVWLIFYPDEKKGVLKDINF